MHIETIQCGIFVPQKNANEKDSHEKNRLG